MSDEELPKPGDTIGGKYRVERVLGAGGMGAVFEVTHRVTGKAFAVKWLLPDLSGRSDAIKRFIREAQVAGRFEHPNVVEVYDVGQERGSFYMVMELLRGEPLSERLLKRRRLSVQEACGILIPCMRGVARAHDAGIVHRDLKPDNIFLCEGTDSRPEQAKVLDFGISKMSELQGEVAASITKTGMVMGTPHYMAPEQIRGKGMDHRVDVYAFGVILYQLLSGELPFPGDTYSELVLKIATETPKPLAEIVPGIDQRMIELVRKAMARDPEQRFTSMEVFAHALEPYAGGVSFAPDVDRTDPTGRLATGGTMRLDTPLSTESQSAPAADFTRKKPLVMGIAVAAALVLGLGAIAMSLLSDDDEVAKPSAGPPQDSRADGTPDGTKADKDGTSTATAQPNDINSIVDLPSGAETPKPETHRIEPATDPADRTWRPSVAQPEAPSTAQPTVTRLTAPSGTAMPTPTTTPTTTPPTTTTTDRTARYEAQRRKVEESEKRRIRELRERRRAARQRKPSTSHQAPPKPEEPTKPTTKQGSSTPSGRLGIQMDATEF